MRNVVTADALAFVAASGLFAMFFFLTLYMQTVQHWSALRTGLSYLPFSVTITATSGVLSRALNQRTPRLLFVAGPLLAAIGLWLMSRLQPGSPYLTALLPALLVTALGLGLIFVPLLNAATAGVADHDSGLASGLVTTSQQIGAAVAIAVLVTIASHQTHQHLLAGATPPQALVAGFHTAFVIQAIILAASALLGATISTPASHRKAPSRPPSRSTTTRQSPPSPKQRAAPPQISAIRRTTGTPGTHPGLVNFNGAMAATQYETRDGPVTGTVPPRRRGLTWADLLPAVELPTIGAGYRAHSKERRCRAPVVTPRERTSALCEGDRSFRSIKEAS